MNDDSGYTKKCNWRIEYEIPPLRAIYFAEIDDCTEAEARDAIAKEQPRWRIRKLMHSSEIVKP